ncbi:hypothetical protein Airi02_077760 [Actinoallomurus iriomotensis]|uniref:Uncharacterized protein n=1 Tax=Actinoallomurus iriomotensis TaxID=478107 RepID=A0A9W6SCQ9_9ACTN|nr:hypothetical protein Airi02_077760 [Actinoallomurus iriomotensis]
MITRESSSDAALAPIRSDLTLSSFASCVPSIIRPVLELISHDLRALYGTGQHALVHQRPDEGWILPTHEVPLPLGPFRQGGLDVPGPTQREEGSGVVVDLQGTWPW